MSVTPTYEVGNDVSAAVLRFANSRESQKGLEGAINLAMQLWISFIMAKQTTANKGEIKAYLMARTSHHSAPVRRYGAKGRESAAKRYLELRDTRAAAIVYASNYKNARQMDAKAFFGVVGKYIAARQYSAGHHKAGFRPALREFKVKRGAAELAGAPAYSKVRSTAHVARTVRSGVVEASASNMAGGVEKNPGGGISAVEAAEGEVVIKLEEFILKNIEDRAKRLGLQFT
ncbi:MAG: hypothetical protein EOP87_00220 [Verrucomicrobiaceae bacterium]|nr:MAG: hypothetical protein EOP87_00220 [Verrucomicrobiaceae bacterium]